MAACAAKSEARTAHLGLGSSVRFLGYQADVTEWLALADISVLPSFFEGLPLAAIEALAAEKPVVASAVDGTPEVVIDEKTGLTVPPGDPDRLAAAICRLLRHPELRRAMGWAGREWVLSEFSEERLVRETEQLYLRAWAERASGVLERRPAALSARPGRTNSCGS